MFDVTLSKSRRGQTVSRCNNYNLQDILYSIVSATGCAEGPSTVPGTQLTGLTGYLAPKTVYQVPTV